MTNSTLKLTECIISKLNKSHVDFTSLFVGSDTEIDKVMDNTHPNYGWSYSSNRLVKQFKFLISIPIGYWSRNTHFPKYFHISKIWKEVGKETTCQVGDYEKSHHYLTHWCSKIGQQSQIYVAVSIQINTVFITSGYEHGFYNVSNLKKKHYNCAVLDTNNVKFVRDYIPCVVIVSHSPKDMIVEELSANLDKVNPTLKSTCKYIIPNEHIEGFRAEFAPRALGEILSLEDFRDMSVKDIDQFVETNILFE